MKELQVGNVVRVRNWMNNYTVTIVRVTKTTAFADKYSLKFRREVLFGDTVRTKGNERFSTTSYTLES